MFTKQAGNYSAECTDTKKKENTPRSFKCMDV